MIHEIRESVGRFASTLQHVHLTQTGLLSLFVTLGLAKVAVYAISAGLISLSGFQPRFDMYFNWDAGFFIGIAEKGYYSPASFAMSPLFPLLIRGSARILLGDYKVSGLFVANLFSFLEIFPAYMLFKYYTDRPVERVALWLFFPLYFVWGLVPYSEHVFSFFVLVTWWCLKANQKFLAVGCAALASLARQPGVLLFVPLFLYFILNEKKVLSKVRYGLVSLLVPSSALLWQYGTYWLSGDPLAAVHAQDYFGSFFATDLITKLDFKSLIQAYSTYTYPNHVAMPFLVVFICLACFLFVPHLYRMDKYLSIYTVLSIGLFMFFLPLISTLRYLSALFPLFLVLKVKVNLRLYVLICILSSSLMLYAFMQTIFIG